MVSGDGLGMDSGITEIFSNFNGSIIPQLLYLKTCPCLNCM